MAAPSTTRTWIVANHPKGIATFGSDDPSATFKLVEQPIPELKENQVLVKSLFFSNDPAQRPAIDASIKAERHYTAPVKLGEPMMARGLAEVVDSKADNLPKGQIVQAALGWNEYVVLNASDCSPRQPLPGGLSLTHYLGAFGGPGLTAYYGLSEVGEVKKGQRVVISGAAGATGSMAVQIAKNILGCSEVIGIAGSDDKCRWVESLGADKCLNYKSASFEQDLIKATDGFVDVYFDNVGGHILDLMLGRLKRHGVVVQCGLITSYNSMEPIVLQNYFQIIAMRLSVRGFIVMDFTPTFPETVKLLVSAVKEGKLKVSDANEQVVDTKFEDVPRTWLRLFEGANTGKLVTKLV